MNADGNVFSLREKKLEARIESLEKDNATLRAAAKVDHTESFELLVVENMQLAEQLHQLELYSEFLYDKLKETQYDNDKLHDVRRKYENICKGLREFNQG